MNIPLIPLMVVVFLFGVQGCGKPLPPISSGVRVNLPEPETLTLVWGNHAGAVVKAEGMLKKFGQLRIVDPSRLQQVLRENTISLRNTAEDEAQIIKVAKLLGVDSVHFVDVQIPSYNQSRVNRKAPQWNNSSGLPTEPVRHLRVSVWGINATNGEMMWSGKAYYPQPIKDSERGILSLTKLAIGRGTCPTGAWRNVENICDWTLLIGKGKIGIETEWKEVAQGRILVISHVRAGLPAEKAGLAVGDVIKSCNGIEDLKNEAEFMMACRANPGQSVAIEVQRDGKLHTLTPTAISRHARM